MTENSHESAIVALLTDLQTPLRLYVRSLLPGDPSAKDVAQQANATIWRKRQDFTPGTNFKAWAFSIARFEVLNYRKRQAKEARLRFSEEMELMFANEISENSDEWEPRMQALSDCLKTLKPKHRDLILHRYHQPAILKDFAEKTGRSLNGLKVTLHRLRSVLLACIETKLRSEAES